MLDEMILRMDSQKAMSGNNKEIEQKNQMVRHIMESKKGESSKIEKFLTIFFKIIFIPLIVFFVLFVSFLFFTFPIHYKELNEFSTEIEFILIILPVLLFSTVMILIFHKPKKILCLDIIQSNKVQDKSEIYYKRLSSRDVEFHERTTSILNNLTRSTQETQEVKINEYLTVRLRGKRTELYVNEEYFQQCMFLLLNIPKENIQDYDEIDSIDEAEDINYSEKAKELEVLSSSQKEREFQITPEQEFQAHCSNLQAWYEHDYDTRLLHRNLAFPLLKKLTEVGDPLAKKVFKEEIALRLESGYPNVIIFLIEKGYLDILKYEELKSILENSTIYHNLEKCATSIFLQLRRKVEKQDRLLRQARNRAKKYKYEYPI